MDPFELDKHLQAAFVNCKLPVTIFTSTQPSTTSRSMKGMSTRSWVDLATRRRSQGRIG